MKYLETILLVRPAIAMAKDDVSAVGRSTARGDAAMQGEFGSLNTGRVRNLSPTSSQQSADAALQHEFGSLNTGRVRNLTKKPQ
ncbi:MULTISPECIES: hypothetical protein [unclassified Caballeronia]|uniref:hypothetical protein n=1 Tax=unclassified Caballeronia TaxID=2646786 RepID=UPI002866667F|nr:MULTISPECIES: hypothetical protein [unclassified Caballeronia]MDR5755226.1 hypothetical protein [Caballeronia sp. LZ024]MDR5845405.1 hypothetical protein [Caballeronia sp. LZ031]